MSFLALLQGRRKTQRFSFPGVEQNACVPADHKINLEISDENSYFQKFRGEIDIAISNVILDEIEIHSFLFI